MILLAISPNIKISMIKKLANDGLVSNFIRLR